MAYYTSRQQDCAQKIKEARANVEKTTWSYRRGGSLDALNAANRKLADANNDMYVANSGMCADDR
jgi:hypothetical protein